jgi:hypothetical protein
MDYIHNVARKRKRGDATASLESVHVRVFCLRPINLSASQAEGAIQKVLSAFSLWQPLCLASSCFIQTDYTHCAASESQLHPAANT